VRDDNFRFFTLPEATTVVWHDKENQPF